MKIFTHKTNNREIKAGNTRFHVLGQVNQYALLIRAANNGR